MKVCIQNLGQYNEGILNFKWIDLPMDEDEITEALKEIGVENGTQYEEYMIADYEDIPVGEYSNIFTLNEAIEENEEFLNAYNEATEDLKNYNYADCANMIIECYSILDILQECNIVDTDYMDGKIKEWAEESQIATIKSALHNVSMAEDNDLVYEDGYGHFESLNSKDLSNDLDYLMTEFLRNNNL